MNRILLYCLVVFSLACCTPNNVHTDSSLEKYFKENNVEGCFALFNNGTGDFTVYNLDRYKDSSFSPASTFNIVSALVGLQTGIITNDSMVVKWDGVVRPEAAWNRNLSMYQGFRVSSVPYFQEVVRRIGKDTMQFWLDSLSYGSKRIKGPIDSFWLNDSLRITPDEQLGLVKRLYFNQLPFYKINQGIVKKAMLFEDKPEYKLSYQTGTTKQKNGRPLSWMVGWIEENRHPYFFVLNIESKDSNAAISAIPQKIVKEILAHLGFMKGKK